MDTTMLIIIGGLIVVVSVILVLRRSWGSSQPYHYTSTSVITSVPPEIANDPQVQAALSNGNKIVAIKRVRELSGVGLKEAKDFVEGLPIMPFGTSAPASVVQVLPTPEIETEARRLLIERHKIEAIKYVREMTGMGLKEAKEYVESLD